MMTNEQVKELMARGDMAELRAESDKLLKVGPSTPHSARRRAYSLSLALGYHAEVVATLGTEDEGLMKIQRDASANRDAWLRDAGVLF